MTAKTHDIDHIMHEMLIRDVVETYPEVMPVLSHYDMDMCCGGGETLYNASKLHGADPAEVQQLIEAALALNN